MLPSRLSTPYCNIPAGRTVNLIGPDGIGKSALLAFVANAVVDLAQLQT
jgi:ABC-type cobalamin transport system ATPase subunit